MQKQKVGNQTCRLLFWLAFTIQTAQAGEIWPEQPVADPPVHQENIWPGNLRAAQKHFDEFPIGDALGFKHPTVLPGGLIASTGPGLFFVKRADLDLYLGPLRALAADARILPAHRPLVALERINKKSAGGRVLDDLLGSGFVLWPSSSGEYFPGWDELLIGEQQQSFYVFHPPYVADTRMGKRRNKLIRRIHDRRCPQTTFLIPDADGDGFSHLADDNPRRWPHCNDP